MLDDGSQLRIVNAVALKLGRMGYEMAVWVGTVLTPATPPGSPATTSVIHRG